VATGNSSCGKRLSEYTIKELEKKNYKFERRDKIGRVEMIVVDPNGNHAVADGRGDDSVSMEK
jgi:gamma-glutamyltranspeptidase/glutathione hydrolase